MNNRNRSELANTKLAFDISLDTFRDGEIYNEDVINQSIEMILMTKFGKRLFNSSFGSSFQARIFDNMSIDYGNKLLDDTVEAIKKWDNRIVISESDVRLVIDPDRNMASLTIPYTIRATGVKASFNKKIVG
jgi:phage baseplate assembly protein W